MYYNTTEKKTKVYSNSAWSDLGGGGGDLWYASGTAAAFDNDVYIGGLYVQGQKVICPAGQNGTDSYCDYVCTDYYVQTGTEGSTTTEYCYNKTGLTSANCGAVGGCKASDYTNCHSQANSTIQYECGVCKYIDTANCVNNIKGYCANSDAASYCAYNGYDNGATNYHCSSGICICDSSGSTTSPDGKDNDCDGELEEIVYSYWCAAMQTGVTGNTTCSPSTCIELQTGCGGVYTGACSQNGWDEAQYVWRCRTTRYN